MFSWILDQFKPLKSKVAKFEDQLKQKRHREDLRLAAIKENHQLLLEQHDKEAQEYQNTVLDRYNELNGETKIHAKPLTAWPGNVYMPTSLGGNEITEKDKLVIHGKALGVEWEMRNPERTPLVYKTAEYLDTLKEKQKQAYQWWVENHPLKDAIKPELSKGRIIEEHSGKEIQEDTVGKKSKPWWKIW